MEKIAQDRLLQFIPLGVILAAMVIGGPFVLQCVLLGILGFVGFWLLFIRSRLIRWAAQRHPLVTDVFFSCIGFVVFPAGITTFFATFVLGLLVSWFVAREREKFLRSRQPQSDMGPTPS